MRTKPGVALISVVKQRQLDPAIYLGLIVLAILLSFAGAYFGRGEPWIFGQSPTIVISVAISMLAAFSWIFSCPRSRQTVLFLVFALPIIAYWIYATGWALTEGQARNYMTFIVPLFFLMMMFKLPDSWGANRVALFLCWITVVIALTVSLFDWLFGPMPDYRWGMWFGPLRELGVDFRWSGPFGHPNFAGPIMALCLVFALSRSGLQRIFLAGITSVILLLTFSRTAMIAAFIGAVVLFIYRDKDLFGRLSTRAKSLIGATAALVLTGLAVLYDTTLDGRDSAYADYFRIWLDHPWLGAGDGGIRDFIAQGGVANSHAHAHNLFIDSLARYGGVGFLLLLIAIVGVFVLTASVAKRQAWPLAILVTYIVVGIAETPFDPLYLTVPLLWVAIGAAAANALAADD